MASAPGEKPAPVRWAVVLFVLLVLLAALALLAYYGWTIQRIGICLSLWLTATEMTTGWEHGDSCEG